MVDKEDKKEKLEIEDILGDDREIDLESAVSEEKDSVVEKTDEVIPEAIDELSDIGQKDVLEKAVLEAEKIEDLPKEKKIKQKYFKQKKWLKNLLIILFTSLITVAIVLGSMYFLDQKNKNDKNNENVEKEEEIDQVLVEEEEDEEEFLYITSEVGLNLREKPDTKSKVLGIIPYSTKILVLEKATGWIKTKYEGKTGWVSSEFVESIDPLIYKNEIYGFGLKFKPSWAGYKFFSVTNPGSEVVATYYVALPTNDKNWDETSVGIEKGYASLFVMGIYTKSKWADISGSEILPAKLGESDKYVYTYLPGQAHPTDRKTQYYEINEIIKSFEVLK